MSTHQPGFNEADQPSEPSEPSEPSITLGLKPSNDPSPSQTEEDFYYDGPYLVFTEAYHLRRGSCCQSGCRHCPYGFAQANSTG